MLSNSLKTTPMPQ